MGTPTTGLGDLLASVFRGDQQATGRELRLDIQAGDAEPTTALERDAGTGNLTFENARE